MIKLLAISVDSFLRIIIPLKEMGYQFLLQNEFHVDKIFNVIFYNAVFPWKSGVKYFRKIAQSFTDLSSVSLVWLSLIETAPNF